MKSFSSATLLNIASHFSLAIASISPLKNIRNLLPHPHWCRTKRLPIVVTQPNAVGRGRKWHNVTRFRPLLFFLSLILTLGCLTTTTTTTAKKKVVGHQGLQPMGFFAHRRLCNQWNTQSLYLSLFFFWTFVSFEALVDICMTIATIQTCSPSPRFKRTSNHNLSDSVMASSCAALLSTWILIRSFGIVRLSFHVRSKKKKNTEILWLDDDMCTSVVVNPSTQSQIDQNKTKDKLERNRKKVIFSIVGPSFGWFGLTQNLVSKKKTKNKIK